MDTLQKKRNQIADEFKWRLEDLFASDEDWEDEFLRIKEAIPSLSSYSGRLAQGPDQLLKCIRHMHTVEEALGRLSAYAMMRNDEDKSISRYQEYYDRSNTLQVQFNQAVAFFKPELLEIPGDLLDTFFREEEALNVYRQFIDNIVRRRKHTLSASEENILALSGELVMTPASIFGVWESADIIFPQIKDENNKKIQLTNALYNKYQQHPDRRLRKDSYIGLYKPFLEHRNMLASNYSAAVKSHIFISRSRRYSSTLEAALDDNAIPLTIYEKLIENTRANLQPLQRYNALRRRVLKLEAVHDYDLRAPLFATRSREITWEQARQMCIDGMASLGEDYVQNLMNGFEQGWVDVFENKGKRTGAYSMGTYGVHPFVLMNYNGTLSDVFTLAHEMGHALHTWYTINAQPFVYGSYPIFLAEVASTANEALLQKYLIDHAETRQERLANLNAYLDKFSQTFYRQVLFADFELQTHRLVEEGQALTADRLDHIFGELYQTYHGPDFVLDRETKALWSRVPHFYYNYYVFQYSTSFVASAALMAKILTDGQPARDRFLDFLKSGNSRYPIETLRLAGVDMSQSEPVLLTINWMNQLLDEMENLIEKA